MLFKDRIIIFSVGLLSIVSLVASSQSHSTSLASSYGIHYPNQVNQLFNQINPQEMWVNLSTLTNFPDRSAYHESGVNAAYWIKSQVEIMIKNSNRHDAILYMVDTKGLDQFGDPVHYKQPSIVLKIGDSNKPGIMIGAHLDTVGCDDEGCVNDPYGPLPGADDDGSGTVAVLETARTLLSSDIYFNKPIYLIWYAAEEENRIGSKAVVADFKKRNIPIDAVMQLDMIGFAKDNDRTVWISDNGSYRHTNKMLTDYALKLTEAYVKQPAKITTLSDESDHWSWAAAGYKTVFPMESNCHASAECPRREHTNKDTMDKLSLSHMTDYLKLAIAFAVELAEPTNP